ELVQLEEAEEAELSESEDEAELALAMPELTRSNRVVFAEELDELRPGRERWYRFRLATSPIELAREPDWQAFKSRFARVYYVSATLRVADGWEFIRRRLDFSEEEVKAISLDSPFDAATQAELVCFEDFPSWAEQTDAAMHTVAHQLGGYATEL